MHGVDLGWLWVYFHSLAWMPMVLVLLSQALQEGTTLLRIKIAETNTPQKYLFF